jgi:ABC-type antimicrobial peptide transport system permease subunit
MTTMGIAVCISFLTGTISLVEGLHASTSQFSNAFEHGLIAVYDGNVLSQSIIESSTVDYINCEYAACTVVKTKIEFGNESIETYAISIYDPFNLLDLNGAELTMNDILIGKQLKAEMENKNITVSDGMNITLAKDDKEVILQVRGIHQNTLFSDDWIFVSKNVVTQLNPQMQSAYSFLLLSENNIDIIHQLEEEGYTTQSLVSVTKFLELGIYQIENQLYFVVLTSAIIIILLVYSILNIEIECSIADIKILKYMGASQKLVLSIFLLQTVFISLLGGVIGVAIGFIAANALVSFTPLIGFHSMILPQASISSISLPIFVGIISGIIGGFIPAYKASTIDVKAEGR